MLSDVPTSNGVPAAPIRPINDQQGRPGAVKGEEELMQLLHGSPLGETLQFPVQSPVAQSS
jgi:hypothetical protein